MKPSLISFTSLALLLLAGWQMAGVLSRTPAFNSALRVENADGRSFTGYAPTMYDRARYYQWMAATWEGHGTEFNATDDLSVVEQAQRRLRDLATRSLVHAPGDPTGWMQIASAEAGLGDPEAALAAMERSYVLAPHAHPRAVARLSVLAGLLIDPQARVVALDRLDPAKVGADLQIMADDRHTADMARVAHVMLSAQGLALPPLELD